MKKLLFAVVATMFAACTTDVTEDVAVAVPQSPETLTVSFEEDSRIQLNEELKTVWTEGDQVSVFYKSDSNDRYDFQGKTGDRAGLLMRAERGEATTTTEEIVVVYPYKSSYAISPEDNTLWVTVPATQYYTDGSYGVGSNIMVSTGTSDQIYLKSLCGWIKLQLTGDDVVKSIQLKGNDGEQIAGKAVANYKELTLTLLADAAKEGNDNEAGGLLANEEEFVTEVTLDLGEGVQLTDEPTEFYISLAPQTLAKGFTVIVNFADDTQMVKSTDKQVVISRNTVQPMGELAVEPQPKDNEIWYTSTDGEVVTPNRTDVFGANIVSNTYENGRGVITFDGPVTEIGDSAFYNCSSLTSVTIPDSVTTLGANPFVDCSNLAEFNGKFASTDKRCLIVDGVLNSFAPADLTEYAIPEGVTSIGEDAFWDCYNLTSVTIPDNVTSIGSDAFCNCERLTSITIPDSVTSIGNHTFNICRSLTSVTIPESVTSIGNNAFRSCSRLTSVTIPDSVTKIGDSAFYNCDKLAEFNGKFASADKRCLIVDGVLNSFAIGCGLTEYTIPDNITSIGDYALWKSGLTSITIPNSVTSIGNGAFGYCLNLTSVTIPDSVTTIGNYAFEGCSSLKDVYCNAAYPPTLDSYVFRDTALENIYVYAESVDIYKAKWSSYADKIVTNGKNNSDTTTFTYTTTDNMPIENVEFLVKSNTYTDGVGKLVVYGKNISIPQKAFYECTTLQTINIPEGVTSIGYWAFYGCSSLTSVTIPDSVTTLETNPFEDCEKLFEFNGKFASADKRCLIVDGVLNSFAPAGLTEYTIPDVVTLIGEWAFTSCDSLTNVTIPNSVTSIGYAAFSSCSGLTSISIPDSVTSIGNSAFNSCIGLTSITIPNSVTSIGNGAFSSCSSLTSVTIPDSVTKIGDSAFEGCDKLAEFNGKFASSDKRCLIVDGVLSSFAIGCGLTEYAIPDSVTSIGGCAFYNCRSLTSVTIPDCVTSIGGCAFSYCSSLTSVYCKPTTPPAATYYWDAFNSNASGRKIYVPRASESAYEAASGWSSYAADIEPYDFE